MSEPIEQRIQIALDKVRPYLQEDGGDVELVRMRDDGILEVSLTGTFKRCPMSLMTLRAGVERAVMKDIPEIRRVETV